MKFSLKGLCIRILTILFMIAIFIDIAYIVIEFESIFLLSVLAIFGIDHILTDWFPSWKKYKNYPIIKINKNK